MPRIKWFTKDEIIYFIDVLTEMMNKVNSDSISMIFIITIWLYELFIIIMASRYDRYNDNIDHSNEKIFIDYHMLIDMIRSTEKSYDRRRFGEGIVRKSEDFRVLRNHIAHFRVGIEKTYIKTFADYSATVLSLIENAVSFSTILKDRDVDKFYSAYRSMIGRCFDDLLEDDVKLRLGISTNCSTELGIVGTNKNGNEDVISKYLTELDNK